MSVTTPETFKIKNGAAKENSAEMVKELARMGFTGTASNGVITLTNSELAGAGGRRKFARLVRYVEAAGASLTYTAAS